MAEAFTQMYVKSIEAMYDDFCSWYLWQKIGKSYAKAVHHTQMDQEMLNYYAPSPVASIAPTAVLPPANMPAIVPAMPIV